MNDLINLLLTDKDDFEIANEIFHVDTIDFKKDDCIKNIEKQQQQIIHTINQLNETASNCESDTDQYFIDLSNTSEESIRNHDKKIIDISNELKLKVCDIEKLYKNDTEGIFTEQYQLINDIQQKVIGDYYIQQKNYEKCLNYLNEKSHYQEYVASLQIDVLNENYEPTFDNAIGVFSGLIGLRQICYIDIECSDPLDELRNKCKQQFPDIHLIIPTKDNIISYYGDYSHNEEKIGEILTRILPYLLFDKELAKIIFMMLFIPHFMKGMQAIEYNYELFDLGYSLKGKKFVDLTRELEKNLPEWKNKSEDLENSIKYCFILSRTYVFFTDLFQIKTQNSENRYYQRTFKKYPNDFKFKNSFIYVLPKLVNKSKIIIDPYRIDLKSELIKYSKYSPCKFDYDEVLEFICDIWIHQMNECANFQNLEPSYIQSESEQIIQFINVLFDFHNPNDLKSPLQTTCVNRIIPWYIELNLSTIKRANDIVIKLLKSLIKQEQSTNEDSTPYKQAIDLVISTNYLCCNMDSLNNKLKKRYFPEIRGCREQLLARILNDAVISSEIRDDYPINVIKLFKSFFNENVIKYMINDYNTANFNSKYCPQIETKLQEFNRLINNEILIRFYQAKTYFIAYKCALYFCETYTSIIFNKGFQIGDEESINQFISHQQSMALKVQNYIQPDDRDDETNEMITFKQLISNLKDYLTFFVIYCKTKDDKYKDIVKKVKENFTNEQVKSNFISKVQIIHDYLL